MKRDDLDAQHKRKSKTLLIPLNICLGKPLGEIIFPLIWFSVDNSDSFHEELVSFYIDLEIMRS